MKMLSKENLIARTSDIGFCLGLLAGKILIVGFVVASAYGSSGVDRDIDSKTGLGLKQYAQQLKNTAAQLQKRTEELQEQLDQVNAAQSGRQTPSDIAAREIKCLLKDLSEDPQVIIENQQENVKPSSSFWASCCGARTTSSKT
jgi:uncharacterized protein YlxW (UPF0749 family)